MKQNNAVRDTIRKQEGVFALPELTVEFNHNRYTESIAENSPLVTLNSRDPDLYPIGDIVGPHRPARGCLKATLDDATVQPDYVPVPPAKRFHIADQNDYYKYWSSPTMSDGSGNMPSDPDSIYATNTNPQITYAAPVLTNKIVIGLENSLASPTDYDIYVKTTVGGSWTKIADESNTSIDSKGRITLYRQSSSWGPTKNLNNHIDIAGIQLRVNTISVPNQYFYLIEMAALLEKDLTPFLRNVSDTFDLGDSNAITPIGRISSNIGSIGLFNALVDQNDETKGFIFDNENTNTIFENLLYENAKFTLKYIYDATEQGGSATEPIQQFVMYAEQNWGGEQEESLDVSVRDASKFLQEIDAPEMFLETDGQMSVGEIVWRLLDAVGFVDYNIDVSDTIDPSGMDFFWSDNVDKVWDVLSRLAEGTQTAIYFDANGILQIKTKETAFDESANPVWHFRSNDYNDELADIETIEGERKEISNQVTVSYSTVAYKKNANNNFVSQPLWEPEGDLVLNSTDLQADFNIGAEYMTILGFDTAEWPFKGMAQLEGELVSYEGKEYTYIDSTDNNVSKTVLVKSQEEFLNYRTKSDIEYQFLNRFTGRLKITGRGLWNTEEKNHPASGFAYTQYRIINGAKKASAAFKTYGQEFNNLTPTGVAQYENQKGYGQILTHTGYDGNDWAYAVYPGSINGISPKYYGTKFRLRHNGQRDHLGGLMISGNSANGAGYYIEVRPGTNATSAKRAINVYSRSASGSIVYKSGKGFHANIVTNKWYSLDIQFSNSGSTHFIWIWLDGAFLGRVDISSGRQADTDCFGMFTRGSSCYEFDYLYAFNKLEGEGGTTSETTWGKDISFYDRVRGGYYSNQSLDDLTNGSRTASRRVKNKTVQFTQRYNTKFFDEFGPVVHEVRAFDIDFEDKQPGNFVKLHASNEADAKYLDFWSTPFSAHFYAINTTRGAAIINSDEESIGVYARTIQKSEEKTKTFKDPDSIRISGIKNLDFSSEWIQSDSQAENLGEWIVNHWDNETDEISVTVFGNPLIELTDVVQITDKQSSRVNEKYFVISSISTFDSGLTTTLRLRRVKV